MRDGVAVRDGNSIWSRWRRRLAALVVTIGAFAYPAPWVARYLTEPRSFRDPVEVDDSYQTMVVSISVFVGVAAWLVMTWVARRRRLSR